MYDSIEKICRKYGIENYTINEDGSIDVYGNVDLRSKGLIELPLNFNKVTGDFNCSSNKLTSLEFSPKEVGGSFYCSNNKLTNLYGISDNINGLFYCYETPLGSIFNEVDMDFVRAFNSYRVIKDDKVVLKRLKYVMELFDMKYDLEKIKEHYEII